MTRNDQLNRMMEQVREIDGRNKQNQTIMTIHLPRFMAQSTMPFPLQIQINPATSSLDETLQYDILFSSAFFFFVG